MGLNTEVVAAAYVDAVMDLMRQIDTNIVISIQNKETQFEHICCFSNDDPEVDPEQLSFDIDNILLRNEYHIYKVEELRYIISFVELSGNDLRGLTHKLILDNSDCDHCARRAQWFKDEFLRRYDKHAFKTANEALDAMFQDDDLLAKKNK